MYTPEMIEAERELDARIDHALGVTREVEARLDEFEQSDDVPPPSDEDVGRLKAFVLGYARTPEWVAVIDRIDEGELTWRQVVETQFSAVPDRQVAAAFESLSRIQPPSEEKLAEIFPDPEPETEPETPARDSGRRRIVAWPD